MEEVDSPVRLEYERRRDLRAAVDRLSDMLKTDKETLKKLQKEHESHSAQVQQLEQQAQELSTQYTGAFYYAY